MFIKKKKPMKKISTLLMLLFVALQGHSQGLNAELGFNDEYYQYVQGIACDGIYTYLLIYEGETGTIIYSGIGSSSKLVKIDTLGNIIWDVVIAPGSTQCILSVQIISDGDGGLYLFGYAENYCAHPPDGYITFLQKRNSSGNVVWNRDWVLNHPSNLPFSGFTISATGDLLLNHASTGSWVYTISSSGLITDSMLITEPKIEGFAELSGFTVTGFKNNSLLGFDTVGMLTHTITFSTPVQEINSINDTLYVLTQDSIFTFNGNLQPIDASDVPGFSSFKNLKVETQHIRFLSHNGNTINVITLNRQLQVTGTLNIPESISQSAFVDFNDLHLSAGITFNLAEFSAVRFLNYSMNSTQNVPLNRTDIGVINLIPTMVSAKPHSQTTVFYSGRMEADVLIKNYGPDTLHSCRITRYNAMTAVLNPSVYAQAFNNLNLAPGDSMWLSLGTMFIGLVGTSGTEIKKYICIHTNHPNGLVDLNVSNDEFCKEILFGYVGIEEAIQNRELLIYPNPASSMVNFEMKESTDLINSIQLYNIHGRLVAEWHPQTQTASLDISHLSGGMYLARVTVGQNVITRKVVVSK